VSGTSLLAFLVPCAAYLLGAVPFGLLLGKLLAGKDVRRAGSGNIGATNVARTFGPAAGILTLMLDLSKGMLAAWAGGAVRGRISDACLAGFCAILGHMFPVYLGFRGGKGVATGLGVFLMIDLPATLGAALIFAVAAGASRRVSVGSILGSLALPILVSLRGASAPVLLAAWATCLLIIVRHYENVRRLLAGTEPRLGAGKS
jgi:acyl phosphate:glycerol-3-phosphate acyltransferase